MKLNNYSCAYLLGKDLTIPFDPKRGFRQCLGFALNRYAIFSVVNEDKINYMPETQYNSGVVKGYDQIYVG